MLVHAGLVRAGLVRAGLVRADLTCAGLVCAALVRADLARAGLIRAGWFVLRRAQQFEGFSNMKNSVNFKVSTLVWLSKSQAS